jgi:hypothetical protein
VFKRLYVLSLRFKKSILNTPIFRGIVKTVSGIYTYFIRIILYRVANKGLKRLEECRISLSNSLLLLSTLGGERV